jgi:hypothetical protein
MQQTDDRDDSSENGRGLNADCPYHPLEDLGFGFRKPGVKLGPDALEFCFDIRSESLKIRSESLKIRFESLDIDFDRLDIRLDGPKIVLRGQVGEMLFGRDLGSGHGLSQRPGDRAGLLRRTPADRRV